MKLNNQVCSLEQAIKLRQLGIVQNTEYFWTETEYEEGCITDVIHCSQLEEPSEHRGWIFHAAYSVAELGEMLEYGFNVDKSTTRDNRGKYYIGHSHVFEYFDTEAQARAAKLIECLEKGYTDAATCNSRLLNS